jgi:long-chain acyl-CoA synthetase
MTGSGPGRDTKPVVPQRYPALGDILGEHRRSMPQRTALVCGQHRNSWAETDDRVHRVAAAMANAGVGRGDRVLWLGQNSHRLLETLFAAARLGAILCPAGWRLGADDIAFLVDDVEPSLVLYQDATIRTARSGSGFAGTWIRVDGPDSEYEQWLASAGQPCHLPEVSAAEPVLLIYPPEPAGKPNGVLLSHRAWVAQNLVTAWVQGTGADDVFLCAEPLSHLETLRQVLSTVQLGGCTVIAPPDDPELLCRLIDQERCTQAVLDSPTIAALTKVNHSRQYDLSRLRAMPGPPDWNAMVTVDVRPLRAGYAQTELAGPVMFTETARPGVGSAGRVSAIAVIDVVDPDGNPVPVGQVGELTVRGPMVMNGYHRRPEINAHRLRDNWYHTGDLARREQDGTHTIVGPMARIAAGAAGIRQPAAPTHEQSGNDAWAATTR